mgnify:CR=1 FL=1
MYIFWKRPSQFWLLFWLYNFTSKFFSKVFFNCIFPWMKLRSLCDIFFFYLLIFFSVFDFFYRILIFYVNPENRHKPFNKSHQKDLRSHKHQNHMDFGSWQFIMLSCFCKAISSQLACYAPSQACPCAN